MGGYSWSESDYINTMYSINLLDSDYNISKMEITLPKYMDRFGICQINDNYLIIIGGYSVKLNDSNNNNNGFNNSIYLYSINNYKFYKCQQYFIGLHSIGLVFNKETLNLHIIGGYKTNTSNIDVEDLDTHCIISLNDLMYFDDINQIWECVGKLCLNFKKINVIIQSFIMKIKNQTIAKYQWFDGLSKIVCHYCTC